MKKVAENPNVSKKDSSKNVEKQVMEEKKEAVKKVEIEYNTENKIFLAPKTKMNVDKNMMQLGEGGMPKPLSGWEEKAHPTTFTTALFK